MTPEDLLKNQRLKIRCLNKQINQGMDELINARDCLGIERNANKTLQETIEQAQTSLKLEQNMNSFLRETVGGLLRENKTLKAQLKLKSLEEESKITGETNGEED